MRNFPGGGFAVLAVCGQLRGFGLVLLPALDDRLNDDRQHGDEDDEQHDALDGIRDARDVAQKVADHRHRQHPGDRTDDVPHHEVPVAHAGSTCRQRHVGAHDGNEAAQHQRERAAFFEEVLRRMQVLGLQNARVVFE